MVSLLHTTIMQTTFGLQCTCCLTEAHSYYQHMWVWFVLSSKLEVFVCPSRHSWWCLSEPHVCIMWPQRPPTWLDKHFLTATWPWPITQVRLLERSSCRDFMFSQYPWENQYHFHTDSSCLAKHGIGFIVCILLRAKGLLCKFFLHLMTKTLSKHLQCQ